MATTQYFEDFMDTLTEDTTPDISADFVLTKDTSASLNKRVKPSNILGADLVAIRALSPSNDDILQRKAGAWTNRTMAQLKTDLGLATGDSPQFTGINLGHASDTTLTRGAAGVLAVEGVNVPTISSSDTLSNKTIAAPTITGAITFPDDVRQTFNPGTNNAGLNVGSLAGDPSTPSNGDIWYDSAANELTARINGANVALGAGGGGSIDGSGAANRVAVWSDADTLTSDSEFTWDGTNELLTIFGSDSTGKVMIGKQAAGEGAIYFGQSSPSNANAALWGTSTDTILNVASGGNLWFREANGTVGKWDSGVGWSFGYGGAPAANYAVTINTNGGSGTTALGLQMASGQTANAFNVLPDGSSTPIFGILAGGAALFKEQSDPSAPATNFALLYAKDNGSGKTQIVARFPTGAVQIIATEP